MSHSQDILDAITKIESEIKLILGSGDKWYQKLDKVARAVVPHVEVIGQGWAGAEKKALALELVNDLWFRYLDIKYIPNFIEKILVNKVASFAIEKAVQFFNEKGIFKHKDA